MIDYELFNYCVVFAQRGDQEISWKWIEHLYLAETTTSTPGTRMCHKLTRDHVWLTSYTQMRVYLAAQVSVCVSVCVCDMIIIILL